ncbi:hypothetical protein SDC9_141740 [bioreactor metagenome]|uniref:Uncharacterized protein n=1 Tax=bioreactor metagenome TaxID=1076179 RepID=A0A645DYJ4_9ZZZZ
MSCDFGLSLMYTQPENHFFGNKELKKQQKLRTLLRNSIDFELVIAYTVKCCESF